MVQHRREKPKRQNGSHSRRDHCRTCQRRGTLSARRLHRQGSSAPPQSSGSDRSIARRAPLQSPASLRQWTRQPCRWQVVAGDRHPACTCVASLLGVIGIPVPPGSKSGLAASRKGWATAAGRPYRAASSLLLPCVHAILVRNITNFSTAKLLRKLRCGFERAR